jgi:hypothetical protein
MIRMGFMLLAGLIMSWFGFDHLVIHGMMEVFNQTITSTGYYFLFAMIGALQSVMAWSGKHKARSEALNRLSAKLEEINQKFANQKNKR